MQSRHQMARDEVLKRNLASLQIAQPELHTRLHWSVSGEHVFVDTDGEWKYQIHDTKVALVPSVEDRRAALSGIAANPSGSVWLFGVGVGQLLAELLQASPAAKVTAWERDPWILRQALTEHDFTRAIESGTLRFALNADLVWMLDGARAQQIVMHPVLARIYNNERELLHADMTRPRSLVCCGTLFVESLADGLRAEGYSVFSFDAERQSPEELERVLKTWRPEFIAGINYIHGLAEWGEQHGVDYLCWEIDPAIDRPAPLTGPAPSARIFTYRESNVRLFEQAGLENVRYMPLAADPERRKPADLSAEERARYGADVSFVGASMVRNVEPFQEKFNALLTAWGVVPPEFGPQVIAEVAAAQRSDFTRYMVPELLEKLLPGFREHCTSAGAPDPAVLLGEVSAAERRLNYLVELANHDLVVWGDNGWRQLSAYGVRTPGSALHETELPLIYSASTINVDVGRLYQSDIIPMRIFDILACGGFVLAEHSEALANAFDIGVELDSYRTLPELQSKVAHYLRHPEEARTLARHGREAVLARHTIRGRVQEMLRERGNQA